MKENINKLQNIIAGIDDKLNGSMSPELRKVYESFRGNLNRVIKKAL